MELTDRQRKLLFAGLVVLLAAAGVFLTISNGDHPHASARHAATPTPAASTPPATLAAPPVSGPSASPGTYDIYSMLPFTQKDFSMAADVARRFTIAYGTYRFDEDPSAYVNRMRGIITPDLAAQLQQGAAPGVLAQRRQDQEVSTSTATLDSPLRAIAKDQIIFLATGKQHITKGGKSSDSSQQYAVTVTRSGGGWVVYAFAPSDQGDN
jgi:hypothetical protein